PFEWTGVYSLDRGRYELSLADGPDPEMSLVVVPDQGEDEAALEEGAEWCVRRYAEPPDLVNPGGEIPVGKHVSLQLDSPGRKRFRLAAESPVRIGLYAQHLAEEFDLQLVRADAAVSVPGAITRSVPAPLTEDGAPLMRGAVTAEVERTWVAQHEHDDEVGSFAIEIDGDCDPDRLNAWIGELLRERGVDIFRMKGFISIAGESSRFVFQGVHMLFDGQPERPWGDAPRRNQLVFIGRNLDEPSMRRGFEACLV
ncbi:MAG: GTP-binding protein, partial [Chloroflexi bacterium]|nr:GTP-binding protein [Chloroflexota bacterium]